MGIINKEVEGIKHVSIVGKHGGLDSLGDDLFNLFNCLIFIMNEFYGTLSFLFFEKVRGIFEK